MATYLNVANGTGMNETLAGTFGATGANITASSMAGEGRGNGVLSAVVVGVCAVISAEFL